MTGSEALAEALRLVSTSAKTSDEVGRFARTLLPLLKEASEEMSKAVVRPSRRGTGEIRYVVEKTQQGDVLTESRLGGKSKPFRCPKGVYMALAQVLRAADRPLALDEIITAVEKQIGDRPPDHVARTAIRFLMHVQPPLLGRSRARYRAMSPASLAADATAAWEALSRLTAGPR